ncbi:HvfC/BufC N-terminal domain-containing protein [Bordetella pertussis]|uniref:HvfC/BufC N-terminal domain-containing protein n=1 Tax=Bordetella pertussis TaxID=520 RepID=UPI0028EF2D23|nr:DNA-binding domain-containing protein [Bordetella pertussis]WNQ37918.1 DNA-binding domain-containing protein [Bordetella pertussis]
MHPQAAFARALLDPLAPCPPGLRRAGDADPAQRYAIYRNNVVASLIQALADTFPVCRELVGADFFHGHAHAYVARRLPRSPVLARYGGAFAAFVAAHAPAASVPYLADMARLEYLRVRPITPRTPSRWDAAAAGARIAALRSPPARGCGCIRPRARWSRPTPSTRYGRPTRARSTIAEVDPYAAQGPPGAARPRRSGARDPAGGQRRRLRARPARTACRWRRALARPPIPPGAETLSWRC